LDELLFQAQILSMADMLIGTSHTPELVLYGLVAGLLTTVAGQGGGLFLLLVLSFRLGPHAALALSSPALLFGNAHRVVTWRGDIDRSMALRFVIGAFPGAIVGGIFAGFMPTSVLRVVLVLSTGLAIAKVLGWVRFRISERWYGPFGLGVGVLTGSSGGAGVLLSPVLLATGLTGNRYIATQSLIAVAMHVGRTGAYAHAGLFRDLQLLELAALTLAIFGGNALADHVKRRMSARSISLTEYGTMAVCASLAAAGLRP
jgi:uncharacterized protein